MLPKFRSFDRPIIRSFVRSFIVPIHRSFIITIHRSSFVHTTIHHHYSPLLFIVTIHHRYYSSTLFTIVTICRYYSSVIRSPQISTTHPSCLLVGILAGLYVCLFMLHSYRSDRVVPWRPDLQVYARWWSQKLVLRALLPPSPDKHGKLTGSL
jgi:hypothetical protein